MKTVLIVRKTILNEAKNAYGSEKKSYGLAASKKGLTLRGPACAIAHETAMKQKRNRNKKADRAWQPQRKKLVGERKLVGEGSPPVWTNWRHQTKLTWAWREKKRKIAERRKSLKKAFLAFITFRHNIMVWRRKKALFFAKTGGGRLLHHIKKCTYCT